MFTALILLFSPPANKAERRALAWLIKGQYVSMNTARFYTQMGWRCGDA